MFRRQEEVDDLLLDQGGAALQRHYPPGRSTELPLPGYPAPPAAQAEALSATFRVRETHDDTDCGCVNEEITLQVGDDIVLTHVCHDGRVDKVIASMIETRHRMVVPNAEHGTATGTKA